jgi:hypothetical protein
MCRSRVGPPLPPDVVADTTDHTPRAVDATHPSFGPERPSHLVHPLQVENVALDGQGRVRDDAQRAAHAGEHETAAR